MGSFRRFTDAVGTACLLMAHLNKSSFTRSTLLTCLMVPALMDRCRSASSHCVQKSSETKRRELDHASQDKHAPHYGHLALSRSPLQRRTWMRFAPWNLFHFASTTAGAAAPPVSAMARASAAASRAERSAARLSLAAAHIRPHYGGTAARANEGRGSACASSCVAV